MKSVLLAVLVLSSFVCASDWTVDISTHEPHGCAESTRPEWCPSGSIITLEHDHHFQEEWWDSAEAREIAYDKATAFNVAHRGRMMAEYAAHSENKAIPMPPYPPYGGTPFEN